MVSRSRRRVRPFVKWSSTALTVVVLIVYVQSVFVITHWESEPNKDGLQAWVVVTSGIVRFGQVDSEGIWPGRFEIKRSARLGVLWLFEDYSDDGMWPYLTGARCYCVHSLLCCPGVMIGGSGAGACDGSANRVGMT